MIECAACQGQGYVWYRYDLEENRETEVTERARLRIMNFMNPNGTIDL